MAHNEGLTWIGRRTNQWRYSSGGEDRWVQPLSNYIAGEAILRGQPVSIAIAQDIIDLGLEGSDDNIVVLTRTSRHLQTIGIALEQADAGDVIHVLNVGRCSYRSGYSGTEYWPGFTDADRGKPVYVAPTAGTLTLDRTVALTGGLNLIQLGSISTTTGSTSLDIEISIEGDGRGPLDNTQFEYNIGEDVWYRTGDRPPLFAVGNDSATPFRYNLNIARPVTNWASDNKWLAIYSANQAIILIFGASSTPSYTTADDFTRLSFIQGFSSTVTNIAMPSIVTWGQPWIDTTDLYDAGGILRFVNSIAQNILSVAYLVAPGSTLSATYTPVIEAGVQTSVLTTLVGDVNGGPIYVEWDSSLASYFGESAYVAQGSYGQAGTAILADKRYPERCNVLGFLLNAPSDTDPFSPAESDVGLFLRKGLIRFTGAGNELIPGARYFLDVNGQITPSPGSIVYPEALVEIGTARNTTDLMVDISQPLLGQVDYPIAYLRPLADGVTEASPGWLLCDGTSYLKNDYPDLYTALLNIYGTSVIQDPGVPDNFIIPIQTVPPEGTEYYEIKAYQLAPDYQPLTTLVNVLRSEGVATSSITMDITPFLSVGPLGGGQIPTIDKLLPKLYSETSVDVWEDISALSWRVDVVDDTYTLVGDVTGTSAENNSYKLVVYKPEALARYDDNPVIATSVIDYDNANPVNSKAVVDYIDSSVSTQILVVDNSTELGTNASRYYYEDAWNFTLPGTPSWTAANATLSTTNGTLHGVGTSTSGSLTIQGVSWPSGATIRLRMKRSTTGNVTLTGTVDGTPNTTIKSAESLTADTYTTLQATFSGAVTALNILLSSFNVSNTVDLDWMYVGSIEADTLTINGNVIVKDKTDSQVLRITEDGRITTSTTSQRYPTDPGHLINKAYSDLHSRALIRVGGYYYYNDVGNLVWSATDLHGIRQGTSHGFSADMLDERHVGGWGWKSDTTANENASHVPIDRQNRIPEIIGTGAENGLMRIGNQVNMYTASSPTIPIATNLGMTLKAAPVTISSGGIPYTCAYLQLQSIGTTSSVLPAALQLGAPNDDAYVTLVVAPGVGGSPSLEFQTGAASSPAMAPGTATSLANLKAASFQTISTIKAKQDISAFKASALDIINSTEIVNYSLKNSPDRQRVGFIAENTNSLMAGPNHNEMDLGTTLGLALKAIQELSIENKKLKAELKQMKMKRNK